MTDISLKEKVFRVALGAALVFTLFPISTGNSFVDERTHDQAEAIAPAIPVVAVFGTIIIAYGIYVGGTTLDDYNANLDSLFQDFGDFYVGDIEAVLGASWTDDGFINLAAIPAEFWSALQEWSSGLVSSGQANSGSNSNSVYTSSVILGEHEVRTVAPSEIPYYGAVDVSRMTNSKCIGSYASGDSVFIYFGANVDSINLLAQSNRCVVTNGVSSSVDSTLSMCRVYYNDSREVTNTTYQNNVRCYLYWDDNFLLTNSYSYTVSGAETDVVNSDNGMIASVSSGVLDGTAAIPETTVEPFEPTAEQLEAGYSSADIVEAINSGTGEISSDTGAISSDVAAIEGILTGLSATPFGWIADFIALLTSNWSSLLSWLGSTPISTLLAPLSGISSIVTSLTGQSGVLEWMGTTTISELFAGVSSGITGVTDAISGIDTWLGDISLPRLWEDVTGIATGVDGVLAGVNDVSSWWGTLSGWWEGLNQWLGVDGLTLEGVLEGVLSGALAGTLADVIAAINAGVLDIAGTIEGITFPELPRPDPEPGTRTYDVVGLPDWPDAQINQKLGEKAPFCYVIALNDAFQRASGSYSDNPSFYYELEVPYAGSIVFDAGTWLNYDVHGVSIAWLLRVSFNAFMIVLLLGFVYKSMERALSGS